MPAEIEFGEEFVSPLTESPAHTSSPRAEQSVRVHKATTTPGLRRPLLVVLLVIL